MVEAIDDAEPVPNMSRSSTAAKPESRPPAEKKPTRAPRRPPTGALRMSARMGALAHAAASAMAERGGDIAVTLQQVQATTPDDLHELITEALQERLESMPPADSSDDEVVDRVMAEFDAEDRESLKALVARKQLIPVKELAELVGVSTQALSKAIAEHRLFRIAVGKDWFVPAFYADLRIDRKSFEQVSRALGALSGPSKWDFFTQRRQALGGTPLEMLRRGEVDKVIRSAKGFLER